MDTHRRTQARVCTCAPQSKHTLSRLTLVQVNGQQISYTTTAADSMPAILSFADMDGDKGERRPRPAVSTTALPCRRQRERRVPVD